MFRRLFVSLLFMSLSTVCGGAVVPPGTHLAVQQVLHRGGGNEPESLDPARSRGDAAGNILRDLFEGLVTEAPGGGIRPGAADHWDLSSDGRVYTFHIRDRARWSNGKPVTADDFVFALRRTVDPATGSSYAATFAPIVNAPDIIAGTSSPERLGVKALDAHTLQITLSESTPYFLSLLVLPSSFPVYAPSVQEYGTGFTRPGRLVSNGAYQLSDWVVNAQVTLVRNPHYWDDAGTVIDKVIYLPIAQEDSELQRYRAGDLDITYTIPISQFGWIKMHLQDELHIAPYLSTYYYGFNLTQPPLKDAPQLRQALAMAIDRDVLADKVLGMGQLPAYGLVPPGVSGYTPQQYDWAGWPKDRRLAEARRLYAAAGYSEDHPLQIEIRYNTGETHQRIAEAIAAMWKANLGVQTTLVNEEWKVLLADRAAGKATQVYRSGWVGDYDDANTFLQLFASKDPANDTGYASEEYDGLLLAAAHENDPDRRRALQEHAERVLLSDSPLLPIYYYVSKHMVKPYVGGWRDSIVDHHYTRELYIKKH